MLISGPSLLNWGRRTAVTILAGGSGWWHRAGRGPGVQVDQPRSGRAGLAAGSAVLTGASLGVSSPDRVPPQPRPAPPRRPASASVTPAVVRAWAHAQGLPVADRGRIPGWVVDQYLAQQGRPASTRRPSSSSAA